MDSQKRTLVITNTDTLTHIKGIPFVSDTNLATNGAKVNIQNNNGGVTSIVRTEDGCRITSKNSIQDLKSGTHSICIDK